MNRLIPLSPETVALRLAERSAVLIDIREADEFARRHIPGARSHPLAALAAAHLGVDPADDVVFTCRSGNRTAASCDRLAALVRGDAYVLDGGIDAWAAAGLPVAENRGAPLEIMRQVQIAAGLLILAGVVLGIVAAPGFLALAGFVGAGLTFAGVTGWCGMARLLARMPWNRRPAGI